MDIKVQKASKKDINFFYECRNHLSSRRMMINKKFINFSNHKKWYSNQMKSSYTYLYKGILNKKKIGITVFKTDKLYFNADISITIHPSYRGKKLSEPFLKKSIQIFLKEFYFNINLIAQIKKNNSQSLEIFSKLNFEIVQKNKNLVYLKKDAFFKNKLIKQSKIGVIIQARQGSTRLPNKVLKKINGFTIIQLLLARLVRSKTINKIIVAIPKNRLNFRLQKHLCANNIDYYKGSEQNVLKRYFDAAKKNKFDFIVRITSDCPLLEYNLLDQLVKFALKKNVDYVSNIRPASLPQGFSIEIFKFSALKKSYLKAKKNHQKEHVNYYIHENKMFNRSNFFIKNMNFSSKNFSIDFLRDLRFVEKVYKYFFPNVHFSLNDIAKNIKKYG